MFESFKVKKEEEVIEPYPLCGAINPSNVEDKYLTSNQVIIEINDVKVGAIQEFVITEYRKMEEIRIDLSRIYLIDDTLSDFINGKLNEDPRLIIKVVEDRLKSTMEYTMNDCSVDRVSRIYNAEDYITKEEFTFTSKVWSKTIRNK